MEALKKHFSTSGDDKLARVISAQPKERFVWIENDGILKIFVKGF